MVLTDRLPCYRLKGKPHIKQFYGLSETNGACVEGEGNCAREGSIGFIRALMSGKVRDPKTGESLGVGQTGELCFKGPLIMKGYKDNEKATAEAFDQDGFLRTGDVGYYDEEHRFYILDRMKDVIKYKGYQVNL